eukprot:TRINITY_DN2772_c0_g1_i3.p1 TRINITY_DN2772_c0_g1~~TRINITY_DN2772_c0_g1_i3.p1  ORF type:complete len:239 (-),score=39.97 TRINITY_DN2772_c0_g1_i3:63-722(-)
MIVQHMAALNGKRIVLASGSPRRREILTMLGLAHEVHVSAFEENLDKATFPTPADYAKTNAASKAAAVVAGLVAGGGGGQGPDLVIGSDTIVVVDGRILEKPRSEAAAFDMLSSLSGQEHSVLSAVALFTPSRSEVRGQARVGLFANTPGCALRPCHQRPLLPTSGRGSQWTRPGRMASRAWAALSSRASRAATTTSWGFPSTPSRPPWRGSSTLGSSR